MADEPEPRTRIDRPDSSGDTEPTTSSARRDPSGDTEPTTSSARPDPGGDTEPTTRIERPDRGNGPELWARSEERDQDPDRDPGPEPRTTAEHRDRDQEPLTRSERRRAEEESEPATRVEHPNRRKPASKVTRLLVVLLLLISAGLMIIVTLGGWSTLQGAKPVQVAYILVYLLLAFFVARWSRGVLPLIAALAIVLGIFAVVSVPGWYDRDQPGFTDPGLPSDVLGLVTALIVPVQLLLIAVSLSGFRQAWNVEIERPVEDDRPREPRARRGGGGRSPAPA